MEEISQEEYKRIINNWKEKNLELIKSGKCRKVFTDILPKGGKYTTTERTNWKLSIGYEFYFIYEDLEGWVEILDYISNKCTKVKVKYKNNVSDILTSSISKGKIGSLLGKRTKDFKIEIGTRFKDDKRDITIIDRKMIENPYDKGNFLKYYKYKCNKCEFDGGEHWNIKDKKYKDEYWVLEASLLKGGGCSCCGSQSKIVVENINSIYKNDTWMISIVGEDISKTHTHGSCDKIQPICPVCGTKRNKFISISRIYKEKSIGCEVCGDGVSYPNKFAFNLLEQLHIDFETEYSPKWADKRRYDFYFELNDKKYIIEMDGRFHNDNNHLSGQTKEESKVIDDYKDEQARLNGVYIIRIDCDYENNSCNRFEWIKQNILKDEMLNKLFDLSNINWYKCEEFALSNFIKIACEYKRSNPDLTTTQIGKIMGGFTKKGVSNWLVQGSKLGWCNYDPKIENIKSAIKCGKANAKEIEIFKNGISLGIFESAYELQRQSEKLFNIKLSQSGISDVCNEKAKEYKGYSFKFVKKR